MKLNIGCGTDVKKGWINLDKYPLNNDVKYFDINEIPYSFSSGSVDVILLSHVLEHTNNQVEIINECYRLLKKDGRLIIRLPIDCISLYHFRSRHNKDYLNGVAKQPKFYKFLSTQDHNKFYDLVINKNQKRNIINWMYYLVKRVEYFFDSIFFSEYEYSMKKK